MVGSLNTRGPQYRPPEYCYPHFGEPANGYPNFFLGGKPPYLRREACSLCELPERAADHQLSARGLGERQLQKSRQYELGGFMFT